MVRKTKFPTDVNKKAFSIVQIATGNDTEITSDGKNAAAVALGYLGGLKGGKARAEIYQKKSVLKSQEMLQILGGKKVEFTHFLISR